MPNATAEDKAAGLESVMKNPKGGEKVGATKPKWSSEKRTIGSAGPRLGKKGTKREKKEEDDL